MSQPPDADFSSLTPPHGELKVVPDVPGAFAALVAAEITSNAASPELFRIALSGGETARAAYERLAAVESIDWDDVACFLGDERCVPPDDEAANQRLVRETLLDKIAGRPHFYEMDCERLDRYSDLLRSFPGFDVIHLGLGPDGHTASLFPGSEGLHPLPGSLVVRNFDPSGRNPYDRLTLTFEAISKAKLVVFTVAGAAKHDALSRVLAGEELPAARVDAERVVWLCDAEAIRGPQ